MSQGNESVTEKVRLIRWRMTQEKIRFSDEIRLIPRWVFVVIVILFAQAHIYAQLISHFKGSPWNGRLGPTASAFALAGVVTAVSVFVACLIMMWAYVNRDAKRRGMNYLLWTFVAIVIPYFIGIIIYFLVREPLPFNCPQCGGSVSARFNFCPKCKFNLRPTCPECKREIRPGDRYCPHCAHDLATETPTGGTSVSPVIPEVTA